MNRRELLRLALAGAATAGSSAKAVHAGSPAIVPRPADQKYVCGDIVRVVGTNGTSTWWADEHVGETFRVKGSYRDLYGRPTYSPVTLVPRNHPDYDRYDRQDRADYARQCQQYYLVGLDGTGGSAWWDEACLEAVELVCTYRERVESPNGVV